MQTETEQKIIEFSLQDIQIHPKLEKMKRHVSNLSSSRDSKA